MTTQEAREARERMVAEQLRARNVTDPRVLEAMARVPREHFIDPSLQAQAYDDRPLPIGKGQTISQPYIVARMAEVARLDATDWVLEIGTGCGYASAVLARLCKHVYSLEIIPELTALAQRKLGTLGVANVTVSCGDGGLGWDEHAPYDAIIVWAGAPRVPALLLDQLAEGGRLVLPVGEREAQQLVVLTRHGEDYERWSDTPVRFVDLTGRYGWGGSGPPQA